MATYVLPAVLPSNENNAYALVDTAWPFLGISTVLMIGRLYSKIFKLHRYALDDGLMLFAWVLLISHRFFFNIKAELEQVTALVYTAAVQTGFHFGMGRHWEYLTVSLGVDILRWIYIAQAFAIISPALGRISFCFYLLAMIGKTRHLLRYPLHVFIILQAVFNFALIVTLYSVCGADMEVIAKYVVLRSGCDLKWHR